ncbi:3-deoxy-D-manno-octulosonic acid transferase [Marinovum sp.]|uniref:3-deoxy-D-manno-octulosonic acid transferase n=1 Tax=Marinovum sp. TaxID=2024839 RepID=UPI002B278919|nr:glycosyltransferase N-terminal domain-containing protein [Marinovum sp.]
MTFPALPLYRLVTGLAWPLVALVLLARVFSGRERLADWAERTGLALGRAPGPHLWLHAASNGELTSARPLLLALHAARPDLRFLITSNSLTARDLASELGLPGVHARLAPFDTRWVAWLLCRRYGVVGHVLLEAEFWPNRIAAVANRGLPVIAMGARLSARTAQSWRKLAPLSRWLLSRLSFVSPQDAGTAQRLSDLGLAPERLGEVLDLKAFYVPPAGLTLDPELQAQFDREATWLAASTHEGEDEIVLKAHAALLAHRPEARLIIAPRHPRRGAEIAAMARAAGLAVTRRAAGEAPQAGAVYVADTLGEMPLWYQLAGTTFIGGSLVEKGGHTPFEPAVFDSTLLHGPDTRNFTLIFRRLDVAGAAIQVASAEDLTRALIQVRDPERRDAMRRKAHAQLDQPADLADLVQRIAAALPGARDGA